jgi:hypothetical protein
MDQAMNDQPAASGVEENLKSRDTWYRFVFMLVFGVILSITSMVATAIIVLGFLVVLFTGERNDQLRGAGASVSNYIRDVLRYLSYNTDDKPFPFGAEFPGAD